MVFLLPASPVHAAGPTVSLSTISSGVLTAVTTGQTVGTTIVVSGNSFLPANPIAITSTVGSTTVNWFKNGGNACTAIGFTSFANGGIGTANSLITGGCLTTTATGNFQVSVSEPNLPGGAESIVVSDGTNSVTTPITVAASVTFTATSANYGFPQQSITGTLTAAGFGSAESVSASTTAWSSPASAALVCTTGSALGNYGSCTISSGPFVVADTTGGSKSVTATGGTSGLSASTTFTVNPWAAFYDSAAGKTEFSFIGSAPTSVLIEAHGLPAGTIAANSITIGGIAANHQSVVVGTSGGFGGVGGQLVVAPTAQVPFGAVTVVIAGTSFNYATGNVALGSGTWGGAIISSIVGSGTSTGVMVTDGASYKPGSVTTASTTSPAPAQGKVAFFGYGFVPGGGAVAIANGGSNLGALTFNVAGGASCTTTCDANGAVFATSALGDTAWSLAASPTVAAVYTLTTTQPSGPANILSPSIGISPWIDTTKNAFTVNGAAGGSSPSVDYISTLIANVHGFGPTDVVTITVGGVAMVSGGTTGPNANGNGATASGQVPDIASGKQNVVATGSITGATVTATGAVTYKPRVDSSGGNGALSINTGGAGQTTILRTGNGYGAHGLAASTAYTIIWNPIGGSVSEGTFTSTSTGGIPVPGVQFTVPSDSSGIHLLDIQAAGTSAIYGGTKIGDFSPSEAPFASPQLTSQYGDLMFSNIALLSATPSVAMIGAPELLSGSGLAAGTQYVVALSTSSGSVSTTAAALATFISTSSGAVPASTSITLTDTATTTETGTVMYFQEQTAAHFGTTTSPDATAKVVLAANAGDNATSEPAGHAVTLTAHALNSGGVYTIIFNYVQSLLNPTVYTGTPVGIIAPNSVGAGTTSWNIPTGAQTGTYTVQLVVSTQGGGGLAVGTAVLDQPITISVGGVTGSCTNEGTGCMTAPSAPTQVQVGANKALQISYTNNSNAPQTAIVYAVIHNAAGQTVAYTTATISPAAGGSQLAQLILFGLAPGTYSATVFATSTGGVALSSTSTVSVTI